MEYWDPDQDFQGYFYHMSGDQEQGFKRLLKDSYETPPNSVWTVLESSKRRQKYLYPGLTLDSHKLGNSQSLLTSQGCWMIPEMSHNLIENYTFNPLARNVQHCVLGDLSPPL